MIGPVKLAAGKHRQEDWRWRRARFAVRFRWPIRLLHRTGSFLIILAVWIFLSHFSIVPSYKLPSPLLVVKSFADMVWKGILPTYIAASLLHLFSAALIGILVAVPIGIVVGLNRYAASLFFPLFNFFQSLSGIVWIPLLIIWFGFSERTIIAAVNYTVVFPVIFNTLVGVRTVPTVYINAVRTLGGGRWRVVKDALLPGALPNIVTGVRLGIAFGWRALVAGEMLVGADGLGFMIFKAQTVNKTPTIMAGMILIGLLWALIDQFLLRPVEELTIARWGLVQR